MPLLSDVEVEEVLAIDIALERLAQVDERANRVVECRIFARPDARRDRASALGISTKSVQRSWTTARAWLRKEIGREVCRAMTRRGGHVQSRQSCDAITLKEASWTACTGSASKSCSSRRTPCRPRRARGSSPKSAAHQPALRARSKRCWRPPMPTGRCRRTLRRRSRGRDAGVDADPLLGQRLGPWRLTQRHRPRRHGHGLWRGARRRAVSAGCGGQVRAGGPARWTRDRALPDRASGARLVEASEHRGPARRRVRFRWHALSGDGAGRWRAHHRMVRRRASRPLEPDGACDCSVSCATPCSTRIARSSCIAISSRGTSSSRERAA